MRAVLLATIILTVILLMGIFYYVRWRKHIPIKDNVVDTSRMVLIPGGEFFMGSTMEEIEEVVREYGGKISWYNDEVPPKKVFVKAYLIDKFEVTTGEYRMYLETLKEKSSLPKLIDDDHPVTNISWHEAKKYCNWLGKRLPTEAEWEKAARGVDRRIFPWGNKFSTERCNTEESHIKGTTPVGKYKEGVSPYGVYDMCGNVWEWTSTGWFKKIVKGGSWRQNASIARTAKRYRIKKTERHDNLGFRCAISYDLVSNLVKSGDNP